MTISVTFDRSSWDRTSKALDKLASSKERENLVHRAAVNGIESDRETGERGRVHHPRSDRRSLAPNHLAAVHGRELAPGGASAHRRLPDSDPDPKASVNEGRPRGRDRRVPIARRRPAEVQRAPRRRRIRARGAESASQASTAAGSCSHRTIARLPSSSSTSIASRHDSPRRSKTSSGPCSPRSIAAADVPPAAVGDGAPHHERPFQPPARGAHRAPARGATRADRRRHRTESR